MDFLAKVNELNAKAGQLNQQRQRNMGQLETLQRQLNDDIAMYNKTYGTSLTLDGVEEEYKKVSEEVTQKARVVEQVIACIEAGNFKDAESLVSGCHSDTVMGADRGVTDNTKGVMSDETSAPVRSVSDLVESDTTGTETATDIGGIKPPDSVVPSGIFSESLGSADEDESVSYDDSFLTGVTPKPVGVSTSEQVAVDDDDDDVPLAPPKGAIKPPSFASVLNGTGFDV